MWRMRSTYTAIKTKVLACGACAPHAKLLPARETCGAAPVTVTRDVGHRPEMEPTSNQTTHAGRHFSTEHEGARHEDEHAYGVLNTEQVPNPK
jgi:hypothetical protein